VRPGLDNAAEVQTNSTQMSTLEATIAQQFHDTRGFFLHVLLRRASGGNCGNGDVGFGKTRGEGTEE